MSISLCMPIVVSIRMREVTGKVIIEIVTDYICTWYGHMKLGLLPIVIFSKKRAGLWVAVIGAALLALSFSLGLRKECMACTRWGVGKCLS